MVVKEGDKAPALVGTSYDGSQIDLADLGRRTVLYFYPKASTSG
jgi:peroxiredoxin